MSFVRNDDYLINMVNNMLDSLTGGEHSKTLKVLEEVIIVVLFQNMYVGFFSDKISLYYKIFPFVY